MEIFVLEELIDQFSSLERGANDRCIQRLLQDLVRSESAADNEVGRECVRQEKPNNGGVFGPDLMQELEAGEWTGFQIDEDQFKRDLIKQTKGVVSGLGDVDFPIIWKFREMRFDLREGCDVIDQNQNSAELFHTITGPAIRWLIKNLS